MWGIDLNCNSMIDEDYYKMKRERYFNAIEFKDIKGIIYNSAKQYANNIAFIIKHKKDTQITYEKVKQDASLIKENANKNAKIGFNMTWVGESNFNHHEILDYNKDTNLLFNNIVRTFTLLRNGIVK